MKEFFEENDRYYIRTYGVIIRITKRTPCYVTYRIESEPSCKSNMYVLKLSPFGRKKIHRSCFGMEYFDVPSASGSFVGAFVVAGRLKLLDAE